MPTIFAHALFGWSVATLAAAARPPGRATAPLAWSAALLAMLPDADVVGFGLGIRYADAFGHRGFSHSLVFAALAAGAAWLGIRVALGRETAGPRLGVAAFATLFVATASHALLDMMTTGGLGCALLAPFSWMRLFFPVRPIPVSPIGVGPTLLGVMAWEALFFVPVAAAAALTKARANARIRAVGGVALLLVPVAVALLRSRLG